MKKFKDILVIITGAGAPGAPGIIKSLRLNGERNIKIIGLDSNLSQSVGIGLVDKAYQIPSAESDNFIDEVVKISQKEKVDVIIPLVTKELFVFAQNISKFEDIGVKISISPYKQLQTVNNKFKLMQFCQELGVPTPEFYLVKTLDEFVDKVHQLGYPNKKVCFKPPVSNGMRGFRIISDSTDKMYNLLNEKPNNVYIGFEEFIQIANDADFFPELLVMEYLPGTEYSVDALAKEGKCFGVIPRTRDKIKMGISFVGTTVENTTIIEAVNSIIKELKLNGNIGFQFKEDINGIPKIIESNPRVQGTIIMTTAAGYNMVYYAVKLALEETLPAFEPKWGLKMIRYWDELYIYENKTFKI